MCKRKTSMNQGLLWSVMLKSMNQGALRSKEVNKVVKQLPFLTKEQDDEGERLGFWH